jgi:adenylate cyclase
VLASVEESGQMVANLLARSAGLANEIPNEVEDMLGAQMVAEARIAAHFVDAAEKAGFTPDEINRRLRQLADTTVLDEFWITDEKGHAYLRNIDVDFTFSPSPLEQPQAHVFWPLLSGKKNQVIQEARQRRSTTSTSNMPVYPASTSRAWLRSVSTRNILPIDFARLPATPDPLGNQHEE